MSKKILVVGSVNMDLVMRIHKMPSGGETIFGDGYEYIPGGKGANQAVACARLGGKVGFVTCLGKDAHGNTLFNALTAEGIDMSFSHRSDTPTGLAAIPVDASGQNRIIVFSGANMEICTQDVERALKHNWDAILMQLETPLSVVYDTVALARKNGIAVVLDSGPAIPLDFDALRGLSILSPNEGETETLSGLPTGTPEQDEKAARFLLDKSGAASVVLKLGGRGALLCENGECTHYPTFSDIKPVDTTAAGDSFTAALTLCRAMGWSWAKSFGYAHATGSLCVSRVGAQSSLPYQNEVEEFLRGRSVKA